ncbi:putative DNA replication complex GINS protein PSF1-like [Hibiscus syriacus]|uniref:DNA replication complex GINS protein PSF1-like n=1 Tax=Hibiscus syriacus TaxID=106335 RepID=A0A6A3BRA3_HIBSY|nr:MAPK kinase substrate protein At1g80180-like [Hibiscus syriacus]KAE8718431.1 putative DNA replication complex GINS protein PSF1-like [Hibiscus syriacus]
MAGLQRSAVSFRRQGSSGIVWDDKFLSELSQMKPEQEEEGGGGQTKPDEQGQVQDNNNNPEKVDVVKDVKPTIAPINTTVERSRSNGGERRGYRTGKVSPAIDPPSPKVSACGFCSAFRKQSTNSSRIKNGKRRSR